MTTQYHDPLNALVLSIVFEHPHGTAAFEEAKLFPIIIWRECLGVAYDRPKYPEPRIPVIG